MRGTACQPVQLLYILLSTTPTYVANSTRHLPPATAPQDAVKHVDHGAQTNPNYQNKHTVDHHIKHLQGLEEGKKQPNPLQPDPQAAAAAEPQEAARTTRVTTAETYEALLAANEALSAAQAQMNAAHEQEAARRTTRVTTTETYDALMAANEAHSVAEEVASAESGVADAPSDVQLAPAPEVVLTAIPEVAADGAHESQQAEEVSTAAAPAPMLAPTHGHQKGEHTRTNKHNEAAHKEPVQVPTLSGTPRSKRSTTH